VKVIYKLCKGGFSLSAIAKEAGVSRQLVYAIREKKFRKAWTDEISPLIGYDGPCPEDYDVGTNVVTRANSQKTQ
jgi:hypothetical protein